jgi:hypothetical protein
VRAVWIDEGNDADYAKLRANDITEPFYSVRDPRVTKSYLEMVRGKGFAPGIYAAWNWPQTGVVPPYTGAAKGAQFATWVNGQLERIAPGTGPDFPAVCLNIETHDVPYILGAIQQWRKHRPKRITDFTLEGHQGGLFTGPQARAVAAKVRYIVPQCYDGNMTEDWDSWAIGLDLLEHGFPFGKVTPFLDAAHLDEWWEGYAFTAGRLP